MNKNEKFINNAKIIHNDKYNYSKVYYIMNNVKVIIICPEHGEFEQVPFSHLARNGCPKCANKVKGDYKKLTTAEFIQKAKVVHGYKYDYSKTEYCGDKTKIIIICPEHGEFKQMPSSHLAGNGCKICANIFLHERNATTTDEFIIKANIVHKNVYDYSKVHYINVYNNIIIICPIHGEFEKNPHNHLRGQGCPICKASKGEKIISNYLKENQIKFFRQKTFPDCKCKNKLLFDFYIPKLNCCIEFDGEQHFKEISFFGGKIGYDKRKLNDKIKNEFCESNCIPIYRINNVNNIINELNDIFKLDERF